MTNSSRQPQQQQQQQSATRAFGRANIFQEDRSTGRRVAMTLEQFLASVPASPRPAARMG